MTSEFERELEDIKRKRVMLSNQASVDYQNKKELILREQEVLSKQLEPEIVGLMTALGNVRWGENNYQITNRPGFWELSRRESKTPNYPGNVTTEWFRFGLMQRDGRDRDSYLLSDKSTRLVYWAREPRSAGFEIYELQKESRIRRKGPALYHRKDNDSVGGSGVEAVYVLEQPFGRKSLEALFKIALISGPCSFSWSPLSGGTKNDSRMG